MSYHFWCVVSQPHFMALMSVGHVVESFPISGPACNKELSCYNEVQVYTQVCPVSKCDRCSLNASLSLERQFAKLDVTMPLSMQRSLCGFIYNVHVIYDQILISWYNSTHIKVFLCSVLFYSSITIYYSCTSCTLDKWSLDVFEVLKQILT